MTEPEATPATIAILGPTAVGKSRLAMSIARRLDAEIISADSRQVYRYLDIGTAKPTREDRQTVRHHVLDMVSPQESYTVANFLSDASSALRSIAERSRIALIVGGTGHYAAALLEGTSIPRVAPNPDRRRRLELQLQSSGTRAAISQIEALDPVTAARLDPSNPRRVLRALEILEESGRPVPAVTRNPLPALVIGLTMDRQALYDRADSRAEAQVSDGMVEETRGVLNMGFPSDLPVLRGLGYRQMVQYLHGDVSLKEAIREYKYGTHRLIRRQMTWFRSQPRLMWLDAEAFDLERQTLDQIHRYIEESPKLQ